MITPIDFLQPAWDSSTEGGRSSGFNDVPKVRHRRLSVVSVAKELKRDIKVIKNAARRMSLLFESSEQKDIRVKRAKIKARHDAKHADLIARYHPEQLNKKIEDDKSDEEDTSFGIDLTELGEKVKRMGRRASLLLETKAAREQRVLREKLDREHAEALARRLKRDHHHDAEPVYIPSKFVLK